MVITPEFVDIHQPLHAGWVENRGINTYQRQAFMRGSNFQAWLDSGIIKSLEEQKRARLPRLQFRKSLVASKDWKPEVAAMESCRIVDQAGFYAGRLVNVGYIRRCRETVAQRLHLAGVRLAALLNKTSPEQSPLEAALSQRDFLAAGLG